MKKLLLQTSAENAATKLGDIGEASGEWSSGQQGQLIERNEEATLPRLVNVCPIQSGHELKLAADLCQLNSEMEPWRRHTKPMLAALLDSMEVEHKRKI
ncbi:unnamed protein product [Fusarium graminearum]|nr:unnamed protein product [Fusarium graminearum]CAG2001870.1 unnamed protein product [Fusarium graminearum]VTO93669.1 unnamed protein product [Fusarium graminearum]